MLVATTLTANHEHLIGDALRSVVDWVDVCLVIDTGCTDDSLRIAREIAGEKYRERKFTWSDCAAARNFALDSAAELGGDWALTLDTDERIAVQCDVRQDLEAAEEGLLYALDVGGHYAKERLFRLPARGRWQGPVHESFVHAGAARTLTGLLFSEIPKAAEDYQQRFRRDIAELSRYIAAHRGEPRWYFYLGESHRNLGDHVEAVAAYDTCVEWCRWDEEAAWACFRAAESLCALGRHQEALQRAATGLTRHSGIAELAWLAGFICYQLGRDAQAVYWSHLAITHGLFRGDGASINRIGFRHVAALWEGPYDVLRFAERRRGNADAADEAESLFVLASRRIRQ